MADLGFEGKVAVITGAGGGLGREHALEFARRGARIVVNDLGGAVDGSGSSATAAEAVVSEIEALGGEAVANRDSVATAAGGEAIIQTAIETFGQVDIVVNNAGILRDKTFHNMTDDLLTPVIDVHLKGAFYVTKPAWLHFREQGSGRVINTSSNFGTTRQLRSEQLRSSKDGTRRVHPRSRSRGCQVQHQGQRHCSGCQNPDDRGPAGRHGRPIGSQARHSSGRSGSPTKSAKQPGTCTPQPAERWPGSSSASPREPTAAHDLTVESVRDDWATINDETGYVVPANPGEEFGKLLAQWQSS